MLKLLTCCDAFPNKDPPPLGWLLCENSPPPPDVLFENKPPEALLELLNSPPPPLLLFPEENNPPPPLGFCWFEFPNSPPPVFDVCPKRLELVAALLLENSPPPFGLLLVLPLANGFCWPAGTVVVVLLFDVPNKPPPAVLSFATVEDVPNRELPVLPNREFPVFVVAELPKSELPLLLVLNNPPVVAGLALVLKRPPPPKALAVLAWPPNGLLAFDGCCVVFRLLALVISWSYEKMVVQFTMNPF